MDLTIAIVLLSFIAAPITVPMMLIEDWLPAAVGYLIYAVELPWIILQ